LSSSSAVRTADPAILAEITASLAAGAEVRELLDNLLEPVVRLSQASGGAVRMLSPEGDRFELISSIGLAPRLEQFEHSVDRQCGFCGHAADEARVVWSTDLSICARRSSGAYFGRDCHGALAVPLQHKGRVLGVYNLFFTGTAEPSPAVSALLRSVGELLGLALDHLRLEAENMHASLMRERQRMAGEVHDALAQSLGFVKLRLPLLRDAIEAHQDEKALQYLEEVRETLGEAHTGLREIITHFRTPSEPGGMGAALEALATRFGMRTGIPLHMNNRIPQLQLSSDDEAEVYHIVQEALANVERHAQARQVWLSVQPTLGGAEFRVEDDGVGGVPGGASHPGHHGMEIMRERAQRLRAELTMSVRPGGGTVVRLALPVAGAQGETT
jgi:two-component system nitrate/nitrite sensor histidine kinase NarX